jgi:hypothetical protein
MNREQRRHPPKNNRNDFFEKFALMNTLLKNTTNDIQEGQKVRIDYKQISSRKDYAGMQPKYKQFVEEHRENIFQIKFNDRYKDHSIVSLIDERGNQPIWLFWLGDLIMVEDIHNETN